MGEYLELYADSKDLQAQLNIASMMVLDMEHSMQAIADLCNDRDTLELDLQTLCGLMRMLAGGAQAARTRIDHCATLAQRKGATA